MIGITRNGVGLDGAAVRDLSFPVMRSSFQTAAFALLATALVSAAERLPAVAVMPLSVQGSDSASGGTYAEVIADELLKSGKVRVLERSQMERILKEQGFQRSGACDGSECAVEVGRLLGIEQMVVGSVGRVGQSGVFTLRAVDVGTGEVLASQRRLHEGTPEQAVSDLLPALAQGLLRGMGRSGKVETVEAPPSAKPIDAVVPKAKAPEVRSRTGWSLGANLEFQPDPDAVESLVTGGSLGATWHVASLPWLELGTGADLSLRYREREVVYDFGAGRYAASNTAFGSDVRAEAVLKPGHGIRIGGRAGYFLPWFEDRYDSQGSQRGFVTAALLGWERGKLAIDAGLQESWNDVEDAEGGILSKMLVLSVRWRLR